MTISKTLLPQLSKFLQSTRGESQGGQLTLYGQGDTMKSTFSNTIAVIQHLKKAAIKGGITRFLRQYGISLLLYLIAILLGFETSIALHPFAVLSLLLLICTLCSAVLLFLLFERAKMT